MTSVQDFTEPIKEVLLGNQQAFQFIYTNTYTIFSKAIYSVTKNDSDIEDILQESYIKILQNLHSLSQPEAFIGWGKIICQNTAKDYLRKSSNQAIPVATNTNDDKDYTGLDTNEQTNLDFMPSEQYETSEKKEALIKILDSLPDSQRNCIILWIDNYKTKEISNILNLPLETTKSNIRYAKKKIKEKIIFMRKQGTSVLGITPLSYFIWLVKNVEAEYEIAMAQGKIPTISCEKMWNNITTAVKDLNFNPQSFPTEAITNASVLKNPEIFRNILLKTTKTSTSLLYKKIAVTLASIAIVTSGSLYYYGVHSASNISQTKDVSSSQNDIGTEALSLEDTVTSLGFKIIEPDPIKFQYTPNWNPDNIELPNGVIGYTLYDLDEDGEDELLINELVSKFDNDYHHAHEFDGVSLPDDQGEQDYIGFRFSVFEKKNNEWILQDSIDLTDVPEIKGAFLQSATDMFIKNHTVFYECQYPEMRYGNSGWVLKAMTYNGQNILRDALPDGTNYAFHRRATDTTADIDSLDFIDDFEKWQNLSLCTFNKEALRLFADKYDINAVVSPSAPHQHEDYFPIDEDTSAVINSIEYLLNYDLTFEEITATSNDDKLYNVFNQDPDIIPLGNLHSVTLEGDTLDSFDVIFIFNNPKNDGLSIN